MQQFVWKLFPPYEVRLTVDEAKAFLSGAAMCRPIIEPKVIALAKDAEKTVYSIRIDRMKPDQLALLLVTNVVGSELASGQHHTYRGVLGMMGKDILVVWHFAQKAKLERGYCTEADVERDNQGIQRQVQEAG